MTEPALSEPLGPCGIGGVMILPVIGMVVVASMQIGNLWQAAQNPDFILGLSRVRSY